jgi:hypothetical protein
MAHDWYSKAVLTIIAGALLMLVVQNLASNARAQYGLYGLSSTCGGFREPCYIAIKDWVAITNRTPQTPLDVRIVDR